MTADSPDVLDSSGAEGRRIGRTTGGGRAVRERALDVLRRADGPLPLAEVACRVVAETGDNEPAATRRDEVQRVYLELVRYQVPELERRGVVDYSEEDGAISLAGPGTP